MSCAQTSPLSAETSRRMPDKYSSCALCTCAFVFSTIQWDLTRPETKTFLKYRTQLVVLFAAVLLRQITNTFLAQESVALSAVGDIVAIAICGLRFVNVGRPLSIAKSVVALGLLFYSIAEASGYDSTNDNHAKWGIRRMARKQSEPVIVLGLLLLTVAFYLDEWRYSWETTKVLAVQTIFFLACGCLGCAAGFFSFLFANANGAPGWAIPMIVIGLGISLCYWGERMKQSQFPCGVYSTLLHTGCATSGVGIVFLLRKYLGTDMDFLAFVAFSFGIVLVVAGAKLEYYDWLNPNAGTTKKVLCVMLFFSGFTLLIGSVFHCISSSDFYDASAFPKPGFGWLVNAAKIGVGLYVLKNVSKFL